jgi:thioesterase domain-containing protein
VPQFTDIRNLARHCVRLIRAEQPNGPYAIFGFCQSGHVAFEIAQQLRAEGQEVDMLAILDSLAQDLAPTFHQNLQRVRDLFRGSPKVILNRVRSGIARRLRPAAPSSLNGSEPKETPYCAHVRAARQYKPRRFKGRIVLIRSAELAQSSLSPTYGWNALARSVDVHTIPCPHRCMMGEPAGRLIADALRRYLSG